MMSELTMLTAVLVEYSQIGVGIRVECLVCLSDLTGSCDVLNNFNKFPIVLFRGNQCGVNRVVSCGQTCRRAGLRASRRASRRADRPASQSDIFDPGTN